MEPPRPLPLYVFCGELVPTGAALPAGPDAPRPLPAGRGGGSPDRPRPMTPTTIEDGVRLAYHSIREDRLAIIVGAGLSIPSGLFSGAGVAWAAKQSYDLDRESGEPELSEHIEEQANFFYAKDQLATYYIPRLVPKHAFAGKPNEGHTAVADLLLTRAVRVVVSTNYDRLIEAAGSNSTARSSSPRRPRGS